jgi:hypothetical protein
MLNDIRVTISDKKAYGFSVLNTGKKGETINA